MATYKEIINYLYTQLPMYQRIGAPAMKKGLGNTLALMETLGNPHRHFPSVHIAGTNGKGTVSHMLSAIYQAAGMKVGLYTSPHYKDFRERIKIDGKPIPAREVVRFVEGCSESIQAVKPSFFEITVAMAFDAFSRHHVDIAIVETGLGGRLDSTNVLIPLCSVITNISQDHEAMLGETLEEIALEKAGIIKPAVPVVIGEYQPETAPVFNKVARELSASISYADRRIRVEVVEATLEEQIVNVYRKGELWLKRLRVGVSGPFLSRNLATALRTLGVVAEMDRKFCVNGESIRKAMKTMRSLTGYQGRWQVLQREPLVICDSAHNVAALAQILKELKAQDLTPSHFVLGLVAEKDAGKLLKCFPVDARYYFARPDIPRGMKAEILRDKASGLGLHGKIYTSIRRALGAAKRAASRDEVIYVGGSSFVVAEVL